MVWCVCCVCVYVCVHVCLVCAWHKHSAVQTCTRAYTHTCTHVKAHVCGGLEHYGIEPKCSRTKQTWANPRHVEREAMSRVRFLGTHYREEGKTHTLTHMHKHRHTHAYVRANRHMAFVHAYVHIYAHTHVQAQVHADTQVRTHTKTNSHAHTRTHTDTHMPRVHTQTRTRIHTWHMRRGLPLPACLGLRRGERAEVGQKGEREGPWGIYKVESKEQSTPRLFVLSLLLRLKVKNWNWNW